MNKQFNKDYAKGKQSEKESLKILIQKMNLNLILDEYTFANFDYHNIEETAYVELKTRDDIIFENGNFYYTKNNEIKLLPSLIFDSIKMITAYRMNKRLKNKKDFFVVWKINQGSQYFYWKMNWDRTDTFTEEITADFGFTGSRMTRDVVNVRTEAIKEL